MKQVVPVPEVVSAEPEAMEMMRLWAVPTTYYVALGSLQWADPATWGAVLGDAVNHVVEDYERRGMDAGQAREAIRAAFLGVTGWGV